jgi:hypothetical protein
MQVCIVKIIPPYVQIFESETCILWLSCMTETCSDRESVQDNKNVVFEMEKKKNYIQMNTHDNWKMYGERKHFI